MKLSRAQLGDDFWQAHGYQMPQYEVAKMVENTMAAPTWLHFGAGNIFRAFLAHAQQQLLNEGATETGIIVATGSAQTIHDVYRAQDNLGIYVRLKADSNMDKIVIASVAESLVMREDFARLKTIVAEPSLQMLSFTITEKGYALCAADGDYLPDVQHDFRHGVETPQSYLGIITALLYHRYQANGAPLALVSMDNMSKNGDKLAAALHQFVDTWVENGLVTRGFVDWIRSEKVCFPLTMIDKITPRPDVAIQAQLVADGLEDMDFIVTGQNAYIAPFVNAEECEYLVIEDCFPNGRPPLEKAGVMFTDRDTVNKVETMKVTTCLNPIHTALAIFGCLLGYTSIHETMQDKDLRRLAEKIGYEEGLPVVVNPKIINPKAFIDEVINVRLPNPFIPDTPQRIACDTSQKLSVRFGHTLQAYQAQGKDLTQLTAIPLVLAGWCRYLMGIDDAGNRFECSPDPLLTAVQKKLQGVTVNAENIGDLAALLSDERIFAVDLYTLGLGDKCEAYFKKMLAIGGVRKALQELL